MNIEQKNEALVCTQPACLLQAPAVDRAYLAELLVRVLAGENPQDIVPEDQWIQPRDVCVDCAMRVLGGHHPVPTEAQRQRLIDLGRWTYRRRRKYH